MSKQDVGKFLEKSGLSAHFIDMNAELAEFTANMLSGLDHEQDAMNMIPTYIELGSPIPLGETAIVMDAGGTNFRVAALTFTDRHEAVIEHFASFRMPGADGEIGKEAFFDQIVDHIRPLLGMSRKIGFCFSYATKIYPNKDGRVLNFSKEVRLPEVEGELIGENIRLALKRAGLADDIEIVILNDTVAALLGGINGTQERGFDSYIGFILGTGTNTAYPEQLSKIGKLNRPDASGRMIINMESGTYPGVEQSLIDREIDRAMQYPGSYKFEKMISGRYQGLQLLHTLRHAVEHGLFSTSFAQGLKEISRLDSYEIDQYLLHPYGEQRLAALCAQDEDRLNLYWLIDNLYERASRLVVVNLSAVIRQMDLGHSPIRPVAISAEGTTFYKSRMLRPKIDLHMHNFTRAELGLYHEFIRAENSNLIGAGIAALTNL